MKGFAVAYDKREEVKAVETKPQPELSPNPGENRRSNVNDQLSISQQHTRLT